MKYDKPLVAAGIGALSTIPYEIITRILVYTGIGKYSLYQLDSLVVTIYRPTAVVGVIVSTVVGGTGAVLFYYGLKKLGTDYLILKSILISLLYWLTLEFIFALAFEDKVIPIRPVADYYSHMSGSLVFGTTLGLLFQRVLFKTKSDLK
ncbi:MAG: hypothetical protein ACYDEQ_04995 [Desulfocucumaceae bacterium]